MVSCSPYVSTFGVSLYLNVHFLFVFIQWYVLPSVILAVPDCAGLFLPCPLATDNLDLSLQKDSKNSSQPSLILIKYPASSGSSSNKVSPSISLLILLLILHNLAVFIFCHSFLF